MIATQRRRLLASPRLADQHKREDEEYGKVMAALIAEEVARDLAAGMTVEESADKNAPLYQTMQSAKLHST